MNSSETHAYPGDLARLVRKCWVDSSAPDEEKDPEQLRLEGLPPPARLQRLLSVCYQASLLHEEGRPVTFRIAFAEPDAFSAHAGPPAGLQRLVLSHSRLLDERELRRLAPAAPFERSLIGVGLDNDGRLSIWGIIHSGPRWLQVTRGGRSVGQSFPSVLIVAVAGPGRLLVSKGSRTIATLAGGAVTDTANDVFGAPWLTLLFSDLSAAQWAEHAALHERRPRHARLDPAFGPQLAEHVLRRIVATIRRGRHGGTLIILPRNNRRTPALDAHHLTLKYQFRDEESRRRIFGITVEIMNRLSGPQRQAESDAQPRAGWSEYEANRHSRIATLEEALFEVAHMIAMLADVDGAVVLDDRLEVLGFGAEISGALPDVHSVRRSANLDGTEWTSEGSDRVGTRHRSAYRLCNSVHEALVIVVSQDGGVRFVRWQEGHVTYFDQIATGPWEV